MQKIISGSIEVIEQGEQFLQTVSASSYNKVLTPYFNSSSGEHMRHILDHFISLMNGYKSGLVDYDLRNRKSNIESDHHKALLQLTELKQWILTLDVNTLGDALTIKTEVSVFEKKPALLESSLARELIFVTSHAVHHFSIISIAMQLQDISIDESFGIAPATATYLRNTDDSCAP